MGNRFSSEPLVDRFWRYVQLGDGCWQWTGATDDKGYGQIREGGRGSSLLKAHRVSWMIHNGAPAPELCVLHRCDTPGCVRPDHLFLGTLADNSQDAARKGRLVYQRHPERAPRGERSGSAKLTTEIVKQIRAAYAAGESQSALARRHGVTQAAVWCIVRGKTWKTSEDLFD